MAEALGLAASVAGVVALAGAVLDKGYKYLSSARSSRKDVSQLLQTVAALNTVLSRLVAHAASPETPSCQSSAFCALSNHGILRQCETILREVDGLLSRHKHVNGQATVNLARSLAWPFKEKPISNLIVRIKSLQDACEAALVIDNAAALQRLESQLRQLSLEEQQRDQEHHDMNQDLLNAQQRTLDAVAALGTTLDDIQNRKILLWLSNLDPRSKHEAVLASRQPGTGCWLLHEPLYQNWRATGGSLWLNAPSGVGKTVLASTIIDWIENPAPQSPSHGYVIYHYCDFTYQETLDPVRLFGSLVRQICSNACQIPPRVQSYYDSRTGRGHDLQQLLQLMVEVLDLSPGRCYIVIDGLDECAERKLLFQALLSLHGFMSNKSNFGILVTSRPEHDISRALSIMPTLAVNLDRVTADIGIHVNAEFQKFTKFVGLDQSIKDDVISNLTSRSHGMFRWVQCQLDALGAVRNMRALNQALQDLPVGLERTYDRILESIDDRDVRYVQRALNWLLGCLRPLSLAELVEAVAVDPEDVIFDPDGRLMMAEEIFDICRSLICMDAGKGTVTLAHHSVKEYLLSERLASKEPKLARFSMNATRCTHSIVASLLSYSFQIGGQIHQAIFDCDLSVDRFPLMVYADRFSLLHMRTAKFAVMEWFTQLMAFQGNAFFKTWSLMVKYTGPPLFFPDLCEIVGVIHKTMEFAAMLFLELLLMNQASANSSERNHTVAATLANIFVHLQLSWEKTAEISGVMGYYNLRGPYSPLHSASHYGLRHVMCTLLDNGAAIDGLTRFQCLGNPLMASAAFNHEHIFQELIERGANINAQCRETILLQAAYGSPALVHRLFEMGVDTNAYDHLGVTIHYWARHDTLISRRLEPFKARLELLRRKDPEDVDLHRRRATVLAYVRFTKAHPTSIVLNSSKATFQCLYLSGMQEEAVILLEHQIVCSQPVKHALVCCDLCSTDMDFRIIGPRYVCIDCIDTDFCAACHQRILAHPEIELCNGHRFAEIPRPCWYTLPPGVVNEKGETFEQVLDAIENYWENLDLGDGDVTGLS